MSSTRTYEEKVALADVAGFSSYYIRADGSCVDCLQDYSRAIRKLRGLLREGFRVAQVSARWEDGTEEVLMVAAR